MFTQQHIAFIGPGVMAEAMISGLIRQQVIEPARMVTSGPRQERLDQLRQQYGVKITTQNAEATQEADVVVLSVKPQRLDRVLAGVRGSLKADALVLSIVAGASIEKIAQNLNHAIIVRSMPNTPAQIGEGITVWTASPQVSQAQREMARQILNSLGDELYVEEENYLDMATALSGTGP
ncbi:MAG: NAD(P)-binding domain-containing protein, partial [Anaerolineales bacterium]|nr:NAD(P)-binding domain-containing protein [Anaerolineales bacterium]